MFIYSAAILRIPRILPVAMPREIFSLTIFLIAIVAKITSYFKILSIS